MSEDKLDKVLEAVEPSRRAILKKMVIGAGFAVPIIVSFSVTELAAQGVGSGSTSTVTITGTPSPP